MSKENKVSNEKKGNGVLANVRLSLPSFGEVKKEARKSAEKSYELDDVEKRVSMHNGFIEGAEWMEQQILGNEA
jgi:hypothetical protein